MSPVRGGPARQLHSVGAQFSPAWGTTASPVQPPSLAILESSSPSRCSPPASVPNERLQLGHSPPPPIPLASRSAGRQRAPLRRAQTEGCLLAPGLNPAEVQGPLRPAFRPSLSQEAQA